jgi:DnaJ-class molecular chaperone
MSTHYETLGVEPSAPAEDIKRAYRALVKRWHPDKNPDDPQAEAKIRDINAAWDELSTPERRASYDLSLTNPTPSRVGPQWSQAQWSQAQRQAQWQAQWQAQRGQMRAVKLTPTQSLVGGVVLIAVVLPLLAVLAAVYLSWVILRALVNALIGPSQARQA